jgi:hypothetical protein
MHGIAKFIEDFSYIGGLNRISLQPYLKWANSHNLLPWGAGTVEKETA